MTSLAERLVESYGRLTPANRTWLVNRGVPEPALDWYPGPLGMTAAAPPEEAFTQPIYAEGEASDFLGVAAWLKRDPSRFWIIDGAGDDIFGLGQHLLAWTAYERGSLAVTASPLVWLKHYGATFCPLAWPDSAFELMHLKRIIALPATFGPELRRRLDQARPRLPRIEVAA